MLDRYAWFRKVVAVLKDIEAEAIDPGVPGATGLIRLAQSYLDWASYYTHECRFDSAVVEEHLGKALQILKHVQKAYHWYDGTPSYQSERLEAYVEAANALLAAIRRDQAGDEGTCEVFDEEYVELLEEPAEAN